MRDNLVTSVAQRCANAAATLCALVGGGAVVVLFGLLGFEGRVSEPTGWSVVGQVLALAVFVIVALALLSAWPSLLLGRPA
jgi:hypothetical protein